MTVFLWKGFCLFLAVTGVEPDSPELQVAAKRPHLRNARVVLVGIDHYAYGRNASTLTGARSLGYERGRPTFDNLTGAVRDVRDLEAFFLEVVGLKRDRVAVLTGEPPAGDEGADEVTAEAVLETLKCFAALAAEDDWLIFCYSGHGAVAPLDPTKEDSPLAPYLVMQNNRPDTFPQDALAFADLLREFETLGSARHRLMILDACNSGRLHGQSASGINEALIQSQARNRSPNGLNNSVFLTAARGLESSYENENGGFFIQALLRGLRGFADLSNQPVDINLEEAYTYAVLETMARSQNAQNPYISGGMLKYDLIRYQGADSTCGNIFQMEPFHHTVRANRDLTIRVRLNDASILNDWSTGADSLGLVLQWNLAGQGPFRRTMNPLGNGVFQITIESRELHGGTFTYSLDFQGGVNRNNFQFEPLRCRWNIRVRQ